jgi:hypothetical protein
VAGSMFALLDGSAGVGACRLALSCTVAAPLCPHMWRSAQ